MQVTYDDRIVTWQLNRPEQDNGLDSATMKAMESSLAELERESERLICLLVVGQPAVFSTGLDRELLETCFKDVAIFRQVVERSNRVMDRLEARWSGKSRQSDRGSALGVASDGRARYQIEPARRSAAGHDPDRDHTISALRARAIGLRLASKRFAKRLTGQFRLW